MNELLLSLTHFPKDELDEAELAAFRRAAKTCRGWILTMTTAANSGHPGGSMSSIEMYFADLCRFGFAQTKRR